jgi:hypothetical protein
VALVGFAALTVVVKHLDLTSATTSRCTLP